MNIFHLIDRRNLSTTNNDTFLIPCLILFSSFYLSHQSSYNPLGLVMDRVYIYIYILQSSKSGIGNNSIRTNKIFKFRILNILGKELIVNKIHKANNIFSKKKTKKNSIRSHLDNKFISILLRALI